jgi:hypothetical protein
MDQPPSNWEQTLIGYGIEVGLLVSGFFGALMMIGRRGAERIWPTVASILAGTACANYLTPVVLHFAPETVQSGRAKYAAAFVMGFLGLKSLELIVDKWFGFGNKVSAAVTELNQAKQTRRPRTSKSQAPKARKR